MLFYITVLSLITSVSWAMFCNTSQGTNGWIEQGMSQQDVLAACGQPNSTAQIDNDKSRLNVTQYWNYQQQNMQMLPQKVSAPTPYTSINVNSAGNTLVVEINNNKISSLAVNGNFVSTGSCPNGGFVRVGDTADALAARCGAATQVSYQYAKDTSALPPITQWTYQLQGGQSLIIKFQQGVVSGINQ
jgi:Protein of unknown function (DUF2845)